MRKYKTRKIVNVTKKGVSYVDLVGHRVVRLKAKLPRRRYKDDDHFLDAIYRNNKQFIDSHLPKTNSRISIKDRFKHLTMQYVEQQHISVQSAVDIFASSESMTTAAERMQRNITKAIRRNKTIYEDFKDKLGLKKKEDLDPSKFNWNYQEEAYEYEDYYIEIDNSPKDGTYSIKIRERK